MPINPSRVVQRVIDRIERSAYSLTVYYPAASAKPSAVGAIALPVSPLVPAPNPQPETGAEPERVNYSITMPCLFIEAAMLRQTMHEHRIAELIGWTRESTGLARVRMSDAERPEGGNVFDGADYVEVAGRRFAVLNVIKVTSGVSTEGTYYINLAGWVGY